MRINPDRRTSLECPTCRKSFLRSTNTRYCSDLCRFMAKIKVAGGCWNWTATLDRHGYGTFYLKRNMGAHRASLLLAGECLPEGMDVDHLCRNRACVNPSHLELVTRGENTLRGLNPSAVALRTGCCKNGHPRTPENTYVRNEQARQCRICAVASRARREGSAA